MRHYLYFIDFKLLKQTTNVKHTHNLAISEKKNHGSNYIELVLVRTDGTLPEILPGQFVEVEVPGNKDVFLRRPISVHDVDYAKGTLSLLIQVVGKGTRTLSQLDAGDVLNLVYPLGHGFSMEGGNVLLAGGGAGVAPLLYTAKKYIEKGVCPTILLGGRTADLIPVKEKFQTLGNVHFATDDGSLGEKGLVTEHSVFSKSYDLIATCGPTPMMKAIAHHAIRNGIRCEVSLENMMACGLGACLCCVTQTDQGHKCVCKEGPVFDAKDLTQWSNS